MLLLHFQRREFSPTLPTRITSGVTATSVVLQRLIGQIHAPAHITSVFLIVGGRVSTKFYERGEFAIAKSADPFLAIQTVWMHTDVEIRIDLRHSVNIANVCGDLFQTIAWREAYSTFEVREVDL